MKTISLFNLKGGCGKTTSAINLGYLLGEKCKKEGTKLLYIDCDMQSNFTNSLMEYDLERPCIYHLFTDEKEANDVIYHISDNIDMIPSSLLMATIEPRLAGMYGREFILKRKLEEISDDYAYCLIDCSPSFSIVTTNALIVTDEIYIPVQTEYYAVDGVHLLEETLEYINKSLGVNKEITLLFATLHDKRNNINNLQYDNLKANFEGRFLDTSIRKNISLVESPIFKESIFEYKPKSRGAEDYKKLFKEIEEKGGF
ncbi:MAG: ParA family protein [Eubacterium sp.]